MFDSTNRRQREFDALCSELKQYQWTWEGFKERATRLVQIDKEKACLALEEIAHNENVPLSTSLPLLGPRFYAARFLAEELGDARAIEPLSKIIRNHSHGDDGKFNDTAYDAGTILGKMGLASLPALLELLRIQEPYTVSRCARYGLEAMGAQAVPYVLACFYDESVIVQSQAISVLGGKEYALAPLLSMLGEQNTNVRQCVASALSQYQDLRVVQPLTVLLKDQDQHVRRIAVYGLREVLELYVYSRERMKEQGLEFLLQRYVEQIKSSLQSMLTDSSNEVREVATKTLHWLDTGKFD